MNKIRAPKCKLNRFFQRSRVKPFSVNVGDKVIACKPNDFSMNRYQRDGQNGQPDTYIHVSISGEMSCEEAKSKVAEIMTAETIVMMSLAEYEQLVGKKITE